MIDLVDYKRLASKLICTVCSYAPVNESLREVCVEALMDIGIPKENAEALASGRVAKVKLDVADIVKDCTVQCFERGKGVDRIIQIVPTHESPIITMAENAKRAFIMYHKNGKSQVLFPAARGNYSCEFKGLKFYLSTNIVDAIMFVLALYDAAVSCVMGGDRCTWSLSVPKIDRDINSIDRIYLLYMYAPEGLVIHGAILKAFIEVVTGFNVSVKFIRDSHMQPIFNGIYSQLVGRNEPFRIPTKNLFNKIAGMKAYDTIRAALDTAYVDVFNLGNNLVISYIPKP